MIKSRIFLNFLFLSFLMLLFTACNYAEIPRKNAPATIQAASAPRNVFEDQRRVTDGSLSLSIEPANAECAHINQPFPLKLTFSNLTAEEIIIPSDFSIAVNRRGDGGNLIPLLKDANDVDLLSLADYQMMDIFSTPSNMTRKIPGQKSYETTISYYFPQELAASKSNGGYQVATPGPGQYSIRFVFSEYRRSDTTWYGIIGSNSMRICLQN